MAQKTGVQSQLLITKIQKMVPDAALFDTQHCKELIMSKVKQTKERSIALPNNSV